MEKKRGSHCQSEVSSTGTLKKKKNKDGFQIILWIQSIWMMK